MPLHLEFIADTASQLANVLGAVGGTQVGWDLTEGGDLYLSIDLREKEGEKASTVEIGGQVMTQAQFDAARFPLLHDADGPADTEPDDGLTVGCWVMDRHCTLERVPVGTVESLEGLSAIVRWNDSGLAEKFFRHHLELAPDPVGASEPEAAAGPEAYAERVGAVEPDPQPSVEGEGETPEPEPIPAGDKVLPARYAPGTCGGAIVDLLRTDGGDWPIAKIVQSPKLKAFASGSIRTTVGTLTRDGFLRRVDTGVYAF